MQVKTPKDAELNAAEWMRFAIQSIVNLMVLLYSEICIWKKNILDRNLDESLSFHL